jgi:tetratricopeptide (TPR) repeat protein
MARKTTELDSNRPAEGSSEEDSGPELGKLLQNTAEIILSAFLVLLVIAIFARLIADKRNPPILIDPFGVPKAYEDQGYTAQVVASEVADEITRIERATKTSARKENIVPSNSEALPTISIPKTGLSMDVIVDFLESFLHLAPRHVGGELAFEDESSEVGNAATGPRRLVITVRVNGDENLSKSIDTVISDPEQAISRAASAALEIVDPFILAAYAYTIEKDPETALQLSSECGGPSAKWARNLEGIMLADQHDYPGAIAKYQKAIELDPKYALAYYNWGVVLYDQHDYPGAIAKYQKAIELDPNDALAYDTWGAALADQHDYLGAIAKYQKATELDPNYALTYYNWGTALARQRDYKGAIAKYQKATELDPNYALAYDTWGNALDQQHDYADAIAKYQKATELDPNYALTYYNWGNVLVEQKDYKRAVEKYTKAADLDPQVKTYRSNLTSAYIDWGTVLLEQKDYTDAIAKYKRATEINPNDALAYSNWGGALYAQHDYAGAIAKVQRAINLDPQNEGYRYNLAAGRKALGQAK